MNGKSLDDMTDEERWRLFPIILSNHQTSWEKCFLDERTVLEPIIGSANIVRINHIGSTAVPGLIAKPTVDILLEITEETDIPGLVSRMQEVGYRCVPQDDKPAPGLMFTKGYTEAGFKGQVYHIHVRYKGDWDEPHFREYLLTHPEAAVEYGQLKQDLAVKYKYHRDAYTAGKTAFIKRITNLAKKRHSNP